MSECVRVMFSCGSFTHFCARSISRFPAIKANKKPYADESKRNAAVAVGFVDSLVWQAFASVIVPGFTINRTCAGSLFAMEKVNITSSGGVCCANCVLCSLHCVQCMVARLYPWPLRPRARPIFGASCEFSPMLLRSYQIIPKVPLNTRKWLTTFVGLGMIPLIIHPIDNGVHYVMDKSIRLTYPGV